MVYSSLVNLILILAIFPIFLPDTDTDTLNTEDVEEEVIEFLVKEEITVLE